MSAGPAARRTILEEPWSFSFWEEPDGALVLEVLCGTVAIFEVAVCFTEEQRAAYAREGEGFVRALARRVADAPASFRTPQPHRG